MSSGKFVLRLDPLLHKELKEEAKLAKKSLNAVCVDRLLRGHSASAGLSSDLLKIKVKFNPIAIVLFGSTARGEATSSSDIDLLIVFDESKTINREHYSQWDQLLKNSKISPQFVHLPNTKEPIGSLWLEAAVDGEILYDRNNIAKRTLIDIRSQISKGCYVKKESHGHPYWLRQEANAK